MVKIYWTNAFMYSQRKPLCLTVEQSEELVQLAAANNRINQVGYHNKFVGTFREVKRIVKGGF